MYTLRRAKESLRKWPELSILASIVLLAEYYLWVELSEMDTNLRLVVLASLSSISVIIGYLLHDEHE